MWVRSQDRKKLKEIHDVDIYHDTQIWDGRCFCDAMYRTLLGVKAWMLLPKPYKENQNDC